MKYSPFSSFPFNITRNAAIVREKDPFLSSDQCLLYSQKEAQLSEPPPSSICQHFFLMAVMKARKSHCSFQLVVLCYFLLQPASVCPKNHGNAADDILNIINDNRTAEKLPKLSSNAGLGCIALQYAQECKPNCTTNNTIHCHPMEDDFTQVFAPNCGVELPTFGTISGLILACHHRYHRPQSAFADVLVQDQKTVSLLRNTTVAEAGVGVVGRRKGPYIWCVLFSSSKTNGSTFVLEDLGRGIQQKSGCYSGTNLPCSGGYKNSASLAYNMLIVSTFFTFVLLF